MTAPWITYRPELKVLDCTIRDGGLVVDHRFDDAFVRAVYQANIEAGVDYMEVGYKASKKLFSKDEFGGWKHCDEDDIRRVVGENDSSLKLSAMADAGKSDWRTDILPKDDSVLDMIRVAFYAHQLSEAVDMIKDAADKGYAQAKPIRDWAAEYIVGFYANDDKFTAPDGKTYTYDPKDAMPYSTAVSLYKHEIYTSDKGIRRVRLGKKIKDLDNYAEIWYWTKVNSDNMYGQTIGLKT
ncbi:hypothetical protein LCGC14_2683720, partial [marine sediment metagenome]